MKNIYKLLGFIFITCGLSFSSLASGGNDSSLVEKSPLTTTRYNYLINLKKPSQPLSPASTLKISRMLSTSGDGDDQGIPISFTGAFRFHARWRDLYKNFDYAPDYPDNLRVRSKNLEIGGFGNSEEPYGGAPLLNLNMDMTPAPGFNLGIGIALTHIFSGSLEPDSTRGRMAFGQTFGAVASYKTNFGIIKIGAGNLYTGMSPLFSGWSQVRFNPFYRTPWDVSAQWGGSWSYYDNVNYNSGSLTQNLDPRYTSGGRTQGVILQLADLPGDFGVNISYGADGQTGLFSPAGGTIFTLGPTKKTTSARVYKKSGAKVFGMTGIISDGYFENVSALREEQYMFSGDIFIPFNYITVSLEAGGTAFTSPFGKYDPDSAFYKWDNNSVFDPNDQSRYETGLDFLGRLKINLDKKKFGFPLAMTLYHLGPYYINSNSGTFNTSTWNNASNYIQVSGRADGGWDVAMRRGFIADIGQTANNRRALELVTSIEKGRFKVGIGTQIGQEIQKADSMKWNQVMFYHKLNAWSRASFNYWVPNGGPYNKLLGNYIQLLERVPITDAVIDYRKTFNVFDVDARYKTNLFGRALILADYMSYQSASDHLSPTPYFTDKAFVRVFYNELIGYYHLFKSTTVIGTAAYNKAIGNNRTQLSPETGKPINQETWGFGLGVDWNFAPMMGIYFREMWMSHRDKNFVRDRFEGFETTLELKVMF